HGPDPATKVQVTDALPAGVTFSTAVPPPSSTKGGLTFDLGTLAVDESRTILITVVPNSAGTLSNTASVAAAETDPDPDNSSATITTTVRPASGGCSGKIQISCRRLRFGEVRVGRSRTRSFTIRNTSRNEDLDVSLSGP